MRLHPIRIDDIECVIPQVANGELDGRFLPGREEEFFAEIDRLLGSAVSREFIHHDVALETTADGDLWDAMSAALLADLADLPYDLDRRPVARPGDAGRLADHHL